VQKNIRTADTAIIAIEEYCFQFSMSILGKLTLGMLRNTVNTKHIGKVKVIRWPSNLRPTTRKCVHLFTRGHFRSRDKDGGHIIRSPIAESPMLHANSMALFSQKRNFYKHHCSIVYTIGVMSAHSFTLRE